VYTLYLHQSNGHVDDIYQYRLDQNIMLAFLILLSTYLYYITYELVFVATANETANVYLKIRKQIINLESCSFVCYV